jgi:hypothetical protein
MKYVWTLSIFLFAAPAFAQDPEEALRELGMGGVFATANLPLMEMSRANDPVQQLRRFFAEARMPLANDQVKRLGAIIDAQKMALNNATGNDAAISRINMEFMRSINGVLTQTQNTTWRRFRTEQIMMRGGFPALKLILENANKPLTEEQEKNVIGFYNEFNEQINKETPNRATLDKLEHDALIKVIRILNSDQRQTLLTSRTMNTKPKP